MSADTTVPYVPTRRDMFAMAALTGIAANQIAWTTAKNEEQLAEVAVLCADATIAALDEAKS